MSLPPGYRPIERQGVRAFALPDAADWTRTVLEEHGTFHGWARSHPEADPLTGRGPVFAVPAAVPGPDAGERWAVRHYRRGGAVAPLLGDRYAAVGPARPVREARAAGTARARGVPTPAVVAGAVYGTGPFYRADLVTELIPGRNLARVLFGPPDPSGPSADDALRAAGRLLRLLEKARVVHRDLNAMNVLITAQGEAVTAHALDLDRCRVLDRGARAPGAGMLRRLERSLRRLAELSGRRIAPSGWAALAAGHGGHG